MSAFYTSVARFFDAETGDKTDDLIMFSRLAAAFDGEILDVGCGTGRVLIHLAQAGHRVYGIENDRAMLDRLEDKLERLPQLREHITFMQADVSERTYERRFRLVFLSFNALMHFHDLDAQVRLLCQLRRNLADDGLLVIDLPNAGPAFATEDTDSLTLERKFLDEETGNLVMLQSLSYLDRTAQMLHVDWIYDSIDGDGKVKRMIAPNKLRYYFLSELRLLLERCGFTITNVYGDTEQAPFASDSDRMIVHARGA